MGRGLGCGGVTEGRGVFCRIVTSSATLSSVPASSSHSWHVSGTARFWCVWVGGGGAEVGFWAAAGGEGGVGSSHASWVRAINFSLYFRGGGGEERARGEESEEGG